MNTHLITLAAYHHQHLIHLHHTDGGLAGLGLLLIAIGVFWPSKKQG